MFLIIYVLNEIKIHINAFKKKKFMRLIHNKNICYQFCQIIIEKNNNKLIKTNS